jgi:DNA polymerase-1
MHSTYRDVSEVLPDRDGVIIVVDISAFIYRYFFASIDEPDTEDVVLGGCIDLMVNLAAWNPATLVVAYDAPGKTWRHRRWSQYKQTRKKRPKELDAILPMVWRFVEDMGFDTYGMSGYEADDIVASITERCVKDDFGVVVVSWDKDLACLVRDDPDYTKRVVMYRPAVGAEPEHLLDIDGVIAKYGVEPHQMQDWLALAGDTSDNIPGCKGIGEKRARDLLGIYGNLDEILKIANRMIMLGKKPKKAEGGTHLMKVYNDQEMIKLSKELVSFKYPFIPIRPWMALKLTYAYKFLKSRGLYTQAERILSL